MIRLLNNSDRQVIEEYLERNHMETTFIIGNVSNGSIENNKEIRRCGDYYGFFVDGGLKGILSFYNLGSCIPHYETEQAVSEFVELIRQRNIEYLLGMSRIVKPIYEGIKQYKNAVEYDESLYMTNNNNKSFKKDNVYFKDADVNEEDIDFIVNSDKALNKSRTKEDIVKSITQKNNNEDYIMLISNNKIAAQALIQSTTSRINQIGAVYTLESERGKGYCKAVVSELCSRITQRGKIPTLFVVKNNTPAVRAYSALGFEYFDDYLMVKFKKE